MSTVTDLPEYHVPYVVQSNDIMPIEATFAHPQDPLAELGEPLTREKSIVHSGVMADSDSEKVTIITIEEAYPDGGLRAWLVVLGCFLYACTVLQVYAFFLVLSG